MNTTSYHYLSLYFPCKIRLWLTFWNLRFIASFALTSLICTIDHLWSYPADTHTCARSARRKSTDVWNVASRSIGPRLVNKRNQHLCHIFIARLFPPDGHMPLLGMPGLALVPLKHRLILVLSRKKSQFYCLSQKISY